MMTSVPGTKWSNDGRPRGVGASACLKAQIPIIGAGFPEIVGARPGTINVLLDRPLIVLGYDHRTGPIKWSAEFAPEDFDFVRIDLEAGGKKTPAWLYVAHGSPHRQNPQSHEIITPSEFAIADRERCMIHISRPCMSVPYLSALFIL